MAPTYPAGASEDINAVFALSGPQTSSPLPPSVSRRAFLNLSGVLGTGLVLGFMLGPDSEVHAAQPGESLAPNVFLNIDPTGRILILSKNPEIGQGVKTAMPMIVAEELDAKWSDVVVEQAPLNEKIYGAQFSGGSMSIASNWDRLRQAGAVGRAMLVTAAAQSWKVPEAECVTEGSAVIHAPSKRSLSYGALAARAGKLPVPDATKLKLKEKSQYRLLGTRVGGVDNTKIVTGQRLFGIDQALPGMLYAVYEKCPAVGGRVKEANLDFIKALPGIRDAFVLEGNGVVSQLMPGVAIIGESTWAVFKAKSALQVEWDESQASQDSWSAAAAHAKAAGETGPQVIERTDGFEAGLAGAAKRVKAFYSYPFLPHAPLEPQNCVAWHRAGTLEIWAPTQIPGQALPMFATHHDFIAKHLGVSPDKVTMHQTRVGGGFGRRLVTDFVCEAAAIAMRVNAPVKLQWTRADDMHHDFYRVGGFHALEGGLDAHGRLIAFRDHFITFSGDGKAPVMSGNMDTSEFPFPCVPFKELTQTLLPLMIPCGAWRAPRANGVAFTMQCFLHELAIAAGRDHVVFLLDILGEPRALAPDNPRSFHTGRAAGVIKLAAEKAQWGRPLPAGRGLGLAFHFSHAGYFAEVADVSVDAQNRLKVHKVFVAGDVGPIVNLSGAENQVQGAVMDGYSTMRGLQVTIERGRIQESNFDAYPILRMPDAPDIEVHFIESPYPPTGLGEPALPPAAPAIANAIHGATGIRVRSLPLIAAGVVS